MGANANSSAHGVPVFGLACGFCPLRDWCWSAGLGESALVQIHDIVRRSGSMPAGHQLFCAGDHFTAIYAVRSGSVMTYTTTVNGYQHVHGFHLPGELLGFDAVYPERHRFNAVTLEPSTACFVSYRDISELCRRLPGLQTHILVVMSRELSRQQLCAVGSDATQRVANFLFDVEARLRRKYDSAFEFDLPMSREYIANYLHFTPETMSRVMAKLQRTGVISVDRRHVRLLDVARLGQIAQSDHPA